MALADTSIRVQIVEDMRDSPFPKHSLHLRSYLQGGRGEALRIAAARTVGMVPEDFSALVTALPELAFQVDVHIDRVEWTGSRDLIVVGTLMSPQERRRVRALHGYTPDGERASVPLATRSSATILTILPPLRSFGPDPEARRISAPKHSRKTISTPEEEFSVQYIAEGEGGTGGTYSPSPYAGLYVGTDCNAETIRHVTPETDRDGDDLKDECEFRLAYAFRPYLVMHTYERHYGREMYWAVHLSNGWIKIMYLFGYYYDGGSFAHDGDSEFVVLRMESKAPDNNWTVHNMTTSAHWGVCCGGDNTKTSRWDEIQWMGTQGGRPVVYISKNHHANYESKARCDQRVGDECGSLFYRLNEDSEIFLDRNIGRAAFPFDLDPHLAGPNDCTRSKVDVVARPGMECFFTSDTYTLSEGLTNDFSGWSRKHTETTHYSTLLRAYYMY